MRSACFAGQRRVIGKSESDCIVAPHCEDSPKDRIECQLGRSAAAAKRLRPSSPDSPTFVPFRDLDRGRLRYDAVEMRADRELPIWIFYEPAGGTMAMRPASMFQCATFKVPCTR